MRKFTILILALASLATAQPRWSAQEQLSRLLFPLIPQVRIPGPGGVANSGGGGAPCTPVSGYSHCRLLTLAATTANLTAFPVATVNSSGAMVLGSSRIQNSSCYDVVFTSDSGGSTKIPWEIESCTSSTGAVVAWFPTALSSSTTTIVYVSYDNASISTAQNTGSLAPANVWDSNFGMVQHLAALTLLDSTSNATTGTNTSLTTTTGLINGGVNDAASGYANFAASSSTNPTSAISVSFWLNTGSTNSSAYFFDNDIDSATYGTTFQLSGGSLYWSLGSVGNNQFIYAYSFDSNWHLFDFTYSGSTMLMYIDGAQVATSSKTGSIVWNGNSLALGASVSGTNKASGKFDEFRISGIARAAGWVAAEYANQKASSTFLTVGSEN